MSSDPSLHDLRVTSVRTAAGVLGVGAAALLVWLGLARELRPAGLLVLATAVVFQLAAAGTVGRRWDPTGWAVSMYLGGTIAVIGVVLVGAMRRDPGGFALLLVPVALSGLTLDRARHAATMVLAAATYLVGAGVLGAGISPSLTGGRLVGLLTVGALVWAARQRLEAALASARAARQVADGRAARMEVVARSARTVEASDPSGIVRATLAATAELGWPHAALVLGDETGPALVEARGLRLPADPMVGAVTRAMRLGITIRPSPDDDAIRESRLATVLVAPVRVAGRPRGALLVGDRTARVPDRTDDEALALLAGQAGRALEVAGRLEHEIHRVEVLEERGRERDDFLSTIAHELRTPLTAIIGLSETVRRHRDNLPQERRDDLLARVEANARALEGIVTSMLDLARMERGTLEIRHEPVDLSCVVERTVRRLEPLLVQHVVQVRRDPLAATVLGDARLLERVVENLLTNAGRHTPPGTRIVAATRVEGREVHLTVADDGPGMTDEEIARLGERFQRGGHAATRDTSGVGLGLSLVTEVLRLHGSRLEVESAVGAGTVFTVRLPRTVEVEVELDVSRLDA